MTSTAGAIGATFPLTSSLHVAATARTADGAVGQVLAVAAIGQILGPLTVAVIAQGAGLRTGLLFLPALAVLTAAVLGLHQQNTRSRRWPELLRDGVRCSKELTVQGHHSFFGAGGDRVRLVVVWVGSVRAGR